MRFDTEFFFCLLRIVIDLRLLVSIRYQDLSVIYHFPPPIIIIVGNIGKRNLFGKWLNEEGKYTRLTQESVIFSF